MIVMAAIAAFGGHGAVLGACVVVSAGGFDSDLLRKRRYTTVLFNCAQYVLAAAASAAAYVEMGSLGVWAAFTGAVLVFTAVNFALVMSQVALNHRQRLSRVWSDVRPVVPNYFAYG